MKKAVKILNGFIKQDMVRIDDKLLACEALKAKRV